MYDKDEGGHIPKAKLAPASTYSNIRQSRPREASTQSHTSAGATNNTENRLIVLPIRNYSHDLYQGLPEESARRWLYRIDHETITTDDTYSKNPAQWIEDATMRLAGEAAKWADRNPTIKRMLKEPDTLTKDSITYWKELFLERWEQPEEEETNPMDDLQSLSQLPAEDLRMYYHRALSLLREAGGNDGFDDLTLLGRSVLDSAIRAFIHGLRDPKLKVKLAGYELRAQRSLKGAFTKAEAELRQVKAEQALREQTRQQQLTELTGKMAEYQAKGQMSPGDLIEQFRALTLGSVDAKTPISGVTVTQRMTNRYDTPQIPGINPPVHTMPGQSRERTHDSSRPGPQPAEIPGRTTFNPRTSANVYVRGDLPIRPSRNDPFCTRCGSHDGHYPNTCTNTPLNEAEQRHLKEGLAAEVARIRRNREENARTQNEPRAPASGANAQPLGTRQSHVNVAYTGVVFSPDNEEETNIIWEDVPLTTERTSEGVDVFAAGAKRRRPNPPEDEEEEEELREESPRDPPGGTPGAQNGQGSSQAQRGGRRSTAGRKVGPRKPKQPPKAITGMKDEPPVDIIRLLKESKLNISMLHLGQLSPYVRDEIKRLFIVPRQPRKKKSTERENPDEEAVGQVNAVSVMSGITANDALNTGISKWKNRDRSVRAFGLGLIVSRSKDDKQWQVPRDHVLADQGSDINLIYPVMWKFLKLKLRPVSELMLPDTVLHMRTADGERSTLAHWVIMRVKIAEIERDIWAFACPSDNHHLGMILGIPFLEDVDAHIHIREKILELGDRSRGETVVSLRPPPAPSVGTKLTATKSATHHKENAHNAEEQSDSEDSWNSDYDGPRDEEDEQHSDGDAEEEPKGKKTASGF